MDWSINPLAFLEFFVVIAFGIGWWFLDRHANRAGRRPGDEDADPHSGDEPTS